VSSRYLAGAYAIGALPVGKAVTRTPPKAAPKSTVATRPAPAAPAKPALVTRPAPPAPKPAPKPTTSPATKAKITAAANHAASTSSKLARRHPGMSRALKTISSAMSAKAQAIRGDESVIGVIGDIADWFIGDDSADAQQATGADIAAQAGDIAVQIYNTLDALSASGKTDLMHEGEALVNSCNYIVITIDQMIRSNSSM
jgi:hypothetical protein